MVECDCVSRLCLRMSQGRARECCGLSLRPSLRLSCQKNLSLGWRDWQDHARAVVSSSPLFATTSSLPLPPVSYSTAGFKGKSSRERAKASRSTAGPSPHSQVLPASVWGQQLYLRRRILSYRLTVCVLLAMNTSVLPPAIGHQTDRPCVCSRGGASPLLPARKGGILLPRPGHTHPREAAGVPWCRTHDWPGATAGGGVPSPPLQTCAQIHHDERGQGS